MKNAKKLALTYLREKLGDRKGLNYREIVVSNNTQKEIEEELTEYIKEIQNDALTNPF